MWIWGSGSGKGGGDAGEGAKPLDKVEGGEKKNKEDHFRLVLRDHVGQGVYVTWRTSDLDHAQRSLQAKVATLLRSHQGDSSSPLGADGGEPRIADSPSFDPHGQEESDSQAPVYQSESEYLTRVAMVKIERVGTSDKSRVIKSLPLDTSGFESITSLRVLGAELELDSNVRALVRSSLQVLSLSGQKSPNDKLVSFIEPALSPSLTSLSLRRDQLKSFPASSFTCLPSLRELDLSDNLLLEVSPSLFLQCPQLESLNLQNNPRLTVRGLDFRACKLKTLLLGLIQLDYLPSLAHLSSLTELSLFSLYIKARAPRRDPRLFFEALPVHVELLKASSSAIKLFPSSKEARTELRSSLLPVLRSSSSWHALLGALLACIANERMYRSLISSDVAGTSALHHLLAMCEGSEPLALDACVAVSKLCGNEEGATELLELQIVERFCEVLSSEHNSVALKLFVLLSLRSMAGCSQQVCGAMLADSREGSRRLRYEHYDTGISLRYDIVTETLLKVLKQEEGDRALQREALNLLGDLAFHSSHRRLFLGDARMLATVRPLTEMVKDKIYHSPCKDRVSKMYSSSSSSSSCAPAKDSYPPSPSKDVGDADAHRSYDDISSSSVLSPRIFSPIAGDKERHRALLHGEGVKLEAPSEEAVLAAALRVLAILGDNQTLSRATRLSPIVEHRGLRVLSIDGGGVKGIASIRILQRLEQACGQPLFSLFDLVAGTSAGGIIASAMGNKLNMTEAEKIYRAITRKAFSLPRDKEKPTGNQGMQPGGGAGGGTGAGAGAGVQSVLVREELLKEELQGVEGSSSWWSKLVQSGSSMRRVLLQGAKYDAGPLMQVLHSQFGQAASRRMIESSLDPHACKTAVVSTLVSERPIRPFVFRSYQLPPGMKESFPGRSSSTWLEAMRASSAAPYFFDEFVADGERLQDGAIVTNNPAVVAVHEAQRLWPGRPMELMVSVGTGKAPPVRREVKGSSSGIGMMMETFGELMVEAATSSERVAEAFEVLSPMIPGTSIFRLQVEDERCNVEIDDIKSETLLGIEQAAEDFMEDNVATLEEIACILRSCAPAMAGQLEKELEEEEEEGGETEGGGAAGAGAGRRKGPSPINESSFMLREILNERPLGKHGIGAKLRSLVIESLLPCEEGVGSSSIEMMGKMQIPSQLLRFYEGALTRTCRPLSSSSSSSSADLSVSSEQELDISFFLHVLHRSSANVVQIECETKL